MIQTIRGVLAGAVAVGGTFTVPYPAKKNKGSFAGGVNIKLAVAQKVFSCPDDFTVAYGAANMTVTYNGPSALASGAEYYLQVDEAAAANATVDPKTGNVISKPMTVIAVNLGAPGAASANNIKTSAAQTAAAGAVAPAGGALVAGGVATLDAPTGRNVVAAWTGAAVLTVRGTDIYGKPMSEASASGTAFTGKKAFATVTSIQVSADVTGLTVGTGAVLGLPVYTPSAALVLKELQDNAAAVAGTIVAGLNNVTKSTTTTGDIRGTYAPNAAPDGSKVYELLIASVDPANTGIAAQA